MKLVPHVFIDMIHSELYKSYSYSLNHNSKVRKVDNSVGCNESKHANAINDL